MVNTKLTKHPMIFWRNWHLTTINGLWRELCQDDANQDAKASQDPLSIHGGPMIRSRTKKMKEALNGLIEHILSLDFVQD